MDGSSWEVLLAAAQLLLTISVGVYSWLSHRDRARIGELNALRDQVVRNTESIKHMPTTSQILDLASAIRNLQSSMSGEMSGVVARMSALESRIDTIGARLDRHEEFLFKLGAQ